MLALYEESNISLGEILLQSSEGYVNYLASALKDSDTAMKTINMTNIGKLLTVDQLQEIPYGQWYHSYSYFIAHRTVGWLLVTGISNFFYIST
jgi:hypothetical protein